MKTVFKYTLDADTVLEMPCDAQVLCVNSQPGNKQEDIQLWAMVDTDAELELRRFRVFGTGHIIPTDIDLRYIGTVHMHAGRFVFHVFESLDGGLKK